MSGEPPAKPKTGRVPLPTGYRQGVISAITLFLGFSLLFLRYWSFEASGDWTIKSGIAALLVIIAIVLDIVALWRALQVKDDDEGEYGKTLRWFMVSIIALFAGLLLAGIAYSGLVHP